VSDFIKLSSPQTHEYWEIPILYEDQFMLALDKPASLLATPDQIDPSKANLLGLLHHEIERKARWVLDRQITYLANAHQLDAEISGVILFAKEKPVLIDLVNQFSSEKPAKSFLAIVRGSPSEDEFCVDLKIAPHPFRPGIMRIDARQGKKSISKFVVKERFKGFTLLECKPITDRHHQLRVHLQHRRFRLVSDSIYGSSPLYLSDIKSNYRQKAQEQERPLIGRVAMHLEQIDVMRPANSGSVTIKSPPPRDFEVSIKYLRRFAFVQ
jgi:RluA family pseudouridine synthase